MPLSIYTTSNNRLVGWLEFNGTFSTKRLPGGWGGYIVPSSSNNDYKNKQ